MNFHNPKVFPNLASLIKQGKTKIINQILSNLGILLGIKIKNFNIKLEEKVKTISRLGTLSGKFADP